MRIALDTNFLIYAENLHEASQTARATRFLAGLVLHETFLPVQVLGEFHRVLARKFRWSPANIRQSTDRWSKGAILLPTTETVLDGARDLAEFHQFDIWDAVILSAAAEARCDVLLSEDGHSGFNWRGVTIIDPFAGELHPLAVQLLASR